MAAEGLLTGFIANIFVMQLARLAGFSCIPCNLAHNLILENLSA
jgi:hypothetical protein